jgi:hypothetical protein
LAFGDLSPLLAVQATSATTVTTPISASAISTTFVSIRRFRRCGRAVDRRAMLASCAPPLTKRELYSST